MQVHSFKDLVKWTLEETDRSTIDIQNSLASIVVGVAFLLNNGRLYRQNPAAWQMFEVLPEIVWGLMYAGIGFAHLVFLKYRMDRPRKHVLLVKAGLWIFLGTGLLVGVGWWIPAGWIYYLFAAFAFRGYFKIRIGGIDT